MFLIRTNLAIRRNVFFISVQRSAAAILTRQAEQVTEVCVSNNPPVFIITVATAGDRDRHLRRKRWDNRKNDNRVGGEWVQRRKRWRGSIEERAQKSRDARDDGCRKRGWRTRTGRWREGRDGRAAVSWQTRRGREIERGGAGRGGGWKCRGGGGNATDTDALTSPSLWVIVSPSF